MLLAEPLIFNYTWSKASCTKSVSRWIWKPPLSIHCWPCSWPKHDGLQRNSGTRSSGIRSQPLAERIPRCVVNAGPFARVLEKIDMSWIRLIPSNYNSDLLFMMNWGCFLKPILDIVDTLLTRSSTLKLFATEHASQAKPNQSCYKRGFRDNFDS